MLNTQLHPVFQQVLGEFASAPSSAAVIRQMPARSSVAVAEEEIPTCTRCGFDLEGGCKCPEEGYCVAHGVFDCLRCTREEKHRMHEEERGAIAAEEAMF